MRFERPAELVDISERIYRQIFAIGLWVAVGCTAFAMAASLLQPSTGSQLRGVVACGVCLVATIIAVGCPAPLYGYLRGHPWILLAVGLGLGVAALVVGRDNFQMFLPIVSIIGVTGVAVPRNVVVAAASIAAVGFGAPQLIDGGVEVGGAIVAVVPPVAFWLIVDRIAGFALHLHQSMEASAMTQPATTHGRDRAQRWRTHEPGGSSDTPRLAAARHIEVDGIRLTSRHLQVIMLACEGLKHAEIGACLGIGAAQVGRHLHEARNRIGLQSTPQVVAWAHRTGLVPDSTCGADRDARRRS